MRVTNSILALALLGLALSASACGGGDQGSDVRDGDDGVGEMVAFDVPADRASGDLSQTDADSGLWPDSVKFKEDLTAQWECAEPATCTQDYESFLDKAPAYSKHLTQAAVIEQLRAIDDGEVGLVEGPLDQEQLGSVILSRLGIGFLMEEFDERVLIATTTSVSEGSDYVERHLLLQDLWVGTFEAILLTPKGEGPFPAVVALHGHDETAQIYRDTYHGNDYPAAGYAALFITLRVMGTGAAAMKEHQVSMDLLTNGYTLMGLRVYESILGLKYLRHLETIDGQRIGLVGHGAGSSAGNLAVRVEPGFKAYVSDRQVDYAEWESAFSVVNSESIPDIYPYSALITDFTTSSTPVLTTPDKYSDGMEPVFEFFDQHLKQ